ncbi:hypothetical protein FGRMN_6844 [Fusarium graminum]|nr:hypothetical protein FGRMN_6844 [Fusarium graminum]
MTNGALDDAGDMQNDDTEANVEPEPTKARGFRLLFFPGDRRKYVQIRLSNRVKQKNEADLREEARSNSTYYATVLESLFGLPARFVEEWPGITLFFKLVEAQFTILLTSKCSGLLELLELPEPKSEADRHAACWQWCLKVIRGIRALDDNKTPSIENLYDQLVRPLGFSDQQIRGLKREQIQRSIFYVFCWMSMSVAPNLTAGANDTLKSAAWVESSDVVPTLQDLKRSVLKLFAKFKHRQNAPAVPPDVPGPMIIPNDILYESSINYFSLRNVSSVQLQWVDTLSDHLRFDHSTRVLFLFRLPTLCVANIVGKGAERRCMIQQIAPELLPDELYTDAWRSNEPRSLYQEVLLSYRLIFAQSKHSSKLIQQELCDASHKSSVDPFLVTLCSSPLKDLHKSTFPSDIFPHSVLNVDGKLQESDTYSVGEDFRYFGSRLLILQRYSLRQQPSRVMDIWRDRRNPLQWYTFWAVIWVGGASLVFSFFQLLVGIAQLYFAAAGND